MFKRFFILILLFFSALFASSNIKIINGIEVSSNNDEWESIVSLKWNDAHYCGGTLIAPTWVLTAAHCLVDDFGNTYNVEAGDSVGVGSYNINNLLDFEPKRFISHPSYDTNTKDNDIGLVELINPVEIVKPTAYDTSHSLVANTQTKVAGWGNMSTTGNSFPNNLMEALVPIVDTDTCNGVGSYNGDITSNMFCAGYMESTRDSCQGDSGGPVIIDDTILGIVSWGVDCAKTNFPGVYTKVQNYETWIKSYVPYVVKDDKSIEAVLSIISVLLK